MPQDLTVGEAPRWEADEVDPEPPISMAEKWAQEDVVFVAASTGVWHDARAEDVEEDICHRTACGLKLTSVRVRESTPPDSRRCQNCRKILSDDRPYLPCFDCGDQIGTNRTGCRTCNNFGSRVTRAAHNALAEEFSQAYDRHRHRMEVRIYREMQRGDDG